jgi:hypothetical protein
MPQSYDERIYFKQGITVSGAPMVNDVGTSASPESYEGGSADKAYLITSNVATDNRAIYRKLTMSGAAVSGEAGRFYTLVTGAGAVGVHGLHSSVQFSGSGTCTGEAAAVRATLHVPAAVLGGTNGALYAELYADGTTSNMSNGQFARFVLAGDTTGAALLEDNVALFSIEGGSIASGNMCVAKSSAAVSHVIRIRLFGTAYYLMVSNAI